MPLAAALLIAAKTIAGDFFILFRPTTGFSFIIGAVETADKALEAASCLDFFGEVGIDYLQKLM